MVNKNLRGCLVSRILICFLLIISISSTKAQLKQFLKPEVLEGDQVHVELWGSGGAYSVNFERSVLKRKSLQLKARIGFSITPWQERNRWYWHFIFPIQGFLLLGKGSSMFEISAGSRFWEIIPDYDWPHFWINAGMGYRYQSPKSGLVFRIGPMLSYPIQRIDPLPMLNISLIGAISLGWTLNVKNKDVCLKP